MPLLSVAAMAAIVVLSNVGVQFLVADGWLTWGAFTYPLAFLVTDVTNRLHGPAAARKVVLAGFAVGLLCSAIGTQIQGEFGPLVTWRIAVGSGLAFLAAQSVDLAVFRRLAAAPWWKAPLVSSLVGSVVDTAIFFTVAFAGFLAFLEPGNDVSWAAEPTAVGPLWVGMALADWAVKLGIALLALVPFRLLTRRKTLSVV
ncbi:queuosine precursor transporter [Jannaschia sp. W003]|uniref:queuosine precursor transporter n=1 Tax=Jannaschia sp. W003 TaxID=2867012 RepID=UPI0021A511FF|nr:queuosine precursor transporter [Jannaschia sp. W003]UWQ21284.1 queuosine precursor transporter [Jannaschia sp. W003]